MKEKELLEALDFYGVKDENYVNDCIFSLNVINTNESLKTRVNDLYEILYVKKDYKLIKKWKEKNKEDLFGRGYPLYITSILILMGYRVHYKNMIDYKMDDNQIDIHKKRVKGALLDDVLNRKLRSVRVSELAWASYFINLRIIEIGRLQYEIVFNNPINNKNETCIKIHIPRGEKLDTNNVKESLAISRKEINKYFKITNFDYYCESWLLSKDVLSCVRDDSNISKFSKLFDITPGSECKMDVLKYVFGIYDLSYNLKILKEKTSLQKKLKEKLLKNDTISIGIGRLRK